MTLLLLECMQMPNTNLVPAFSASDVARSTADAYAFHYYGAKQWAACALLLACRGFNEAETRAILYSRIMRTAADDRSQPDRKATSADLLRLLELPSTADYLRENLDDYVLNIIGEDLTDEQRVVRSFTDTVEHWRAHNRGAIPVRPTLRLVWSR